MTVQALAHSDSSFLIEATIQEDWTISHNYGVRLHELACVALLYEHYNVLTQYRISLVEGMYLLAQETEMHIRHLSGLALSLAMITTVPATAAFAQNDSGTKQSMKNAGSDTKNAAKETGHGIKQGTKKVYHKSKRGVKKVAHKADSDRTTSPQ